MDFYKFWEILNNKNLKNEWDPNEPDEGPEDYAEYPTADGSYEMNIQLSFKNGAFYDPQAGKSWPVLPFSPLQTVIGLPEDTYSASGTVLISGTYKPGYDYGGGDAESDEPWGDPNIEIDSFFITNNRTEKSIQVPSNLIEDKIVGINKPGVYSVDYDFNNGKYDIVVK